MKGFFIVQVIIMAIVTTINAAAAQEAQILREQSLLNSAEIIEVEEDSMAMPLEIQLEGQDMIAEWDNDSGDIQSKDKTVKIPAESLNISVWLNGVNISDMLTGQERNSIACQPDSVITIKADQLIAGLYIKWHDYTSPYEVVTNLGDLVQCGTNGFLHEYVSIPRTTNELTLVLHEKTELNDIFAFTEGVLPDWVQVWEPPCKEADLLVIPTHADDEYIFFGGVIPTYVNRGYKVQVVYMVTHYVWERHRLHEQLDGLWEAGVRNYPVIGSVSDDIATRDIGAARMFYDGVFEPFQVEQIRRFKPKVIVGHDENGEYGHGAHQLNAEALKQAVLDANDEAKFTESAEKYGVWNTPKLYLHLYGSKEDRTVIGYEAPLANFNNRSALEVAEDAFAWHYSQQEWEFGVYSYDSIYDSHSFGLYRSTVGPDIYKNDLFENIDVDW